MTALAAAGRPRGRAARIAGNPYVLLLPALVPVLAFSVLPLVQGIALGFTDAEAGLNATTDFTGIENDIRLLDNDLYWSSFRIGLVWAVSTTALQLVLGTAALPGGRFVDRAMAERARRIVQLAARRRP